MPNYFLFLMFLFSLYINQATHMRKIKYRKISYLLYCILRYLMLLESREKYLEKNYRFVQDFLDIVCTV